MTAISPTQVVAPTTSAFRAPVDPLCGLRAMVRLVVRRNRVRLSVWWLVVVGLFVYVTLYYQSIFTSQQALDEFAAVSDVPSIRALTGLAAAPHTMGGAVWTKVWMTATLMLAFGVLFLVTRNGRADEEVGRTELLRSRMLGVHALSAATWLVLSGLCVAVGMGVAVASIATGLDPDGAGVTGSLIMGASLTGVGLVAMAVGAVAGQVAWTSRGANALGSTVLGIFYVLRMMGDLGDGTLTWLSPIGWGQQMQPWGANQWWPLGLMLALTAALLLLALRTEARRDLGAGLMTQRRGSPGAPTRWASPLGLALRLQRGPIIGWTVTLVISALLFGSVVETMQSLVDDVTSSLPEIIRGVGVDGLLALLVLELAMIVTVFAVQSATSLRSDEASGFIEPQLAGAVSRTRWALERLLIPAIGAALLLALTGALLGVSYGSMVGDPAGEAADLAAAALAYWPAVMVFVGLAVALFGVLPRLAIALSWGILAAMWVVILVGDALNLPDWVMDVMPFTATPAQPVEPLSWTPLAGMLVVAAGLTGLGIGRFRSRDIKPG